MKVVNIKNLAFSEQPEPLLARDVPKQVKPREPLKLLDEAEIDLRIFVPALDNPRFEILQNESSRLERGYELNLRVRNFRVGEHVFPAGTPAQGIKTLGDKSPKFPMPLETPGFLPDHLALRPAPEPLPKELQTRPFMQVEMAQRVKDFGNQATTIFAPDNRFVFSDTSFPWGTCGRVDTPLGVGSGVMVGPRHLLTCSHVIQWNANNTTGWIRFRPAFFNGSAPFGDAWGMLTYYKFKVSGPTIDLIEGMYDYVVVVLDRRIGDLTGWMGSRGYTDSWDGGRYWSHVGYPGDLTASNRPTFENSIALDGVWWEFDSHEAMAHRGDVWPGQSGGPFFGWWSGEGWPRVVSVQSSQNSSENNASGGQDMVDLIIQARNAHP